MRIAACALSAVLLSGCSWFGGYGPSNGTHHSGIYAGGQHGGAYGYGGGTAVSHGGGFPQQPDFGATYTTGGYGSHVNHAGDHAAHHTPKETIKKPRLRGTLSLGWEKSVSGHLLDYSQVPGIDPEMAYDPNAFAEGFITGTPATGSTTTTTYTASIEEVRKPDISFDDVYSTPTHVGAGLEFILSPKATIFANGGYTHAQGEDSRAVEVIGRLLKTETTQGFDDMAAPQGAPTTNTEFIPNVSIASFNYNFNDMQRYDLEVGGRYYFDPLVKDQTHRTVTPFVSGSLGMAHYNETKFETTQSQLFYQRAFDSNLQTLDFYDVPQPSTNTQLYDAQWVPTGKLMAGVEFQVTPKAAIALESGVRFEGARDYSNGNKGDNNIAVPVTLRGSFNF